MRDADHHGNALVDEIDGAADEVLPLGQAQIGVFLGFDTGRDHHGGATVVDDIVDLASEPRLIDVQFGCERSERRNNQSWCLRYRHRGDLNHRTTNTLLFTE